ncbi:MAG: PDZ domain-containing protein, partial [Candidatus Omnitrophica bacterium]|nr:PDZ domain-containing protein [Candidatus Omnitrophota bacterium]
MSILNTMKWLPQCYIFVLGFVAVSVAVPALAQDEQPPIHIDYTSYVEQTYPAKGAHFQIYADNDLEKHQRPIRKIGKLIVRTDAGVNLDWEELERTYSRFCREKGADAVVEMSYSHEVDDIIKPDEAMWIESELIVYLDQEEFGHVGFWYHNNRPEIPGVRVEMVVRGSPAAAAGILPGDIIKGISGESTGAMNIQNKQ